MTDYYTPQQAKITEKRELAGNAYLLQFRLLGDKEHIFKPGQFGLLSLNGLGSVPVGYAGSENKRGLIEVLVRSVGSVTSQVAFLEKGDQVGWIGPLGNGFPLEKAKDHNIVILTGGCGIAPFRSVIKYILNNRSEYGRVQLMFGAKAPNLLYFAEEFPKWQEKIEVLPVVEEGKDKWKGEIGNVANLIERHIMDSKNTIVFICGPEPMYQPVVQKLIKKNFLPPSIYLSLERKMKCGIGKCQHCTCGSQYVCLNGPVFDYPSYEKMIKFN